MPTLPFDLLLESDPFHVATYPPGATYGPRQMHNWEFVWMLEGDASYTRDGESVAAPEGSIVLCRPGAQDAFRWDPARRTRHAYFHFELTGDSPPEWPPQAAWPVVRLPASGDTGHTLIALFRQLLSHGHHGDSLQIRLTALTLLATFVRAGAPDTRAEPPLPEAVSLIQTYIIQRLDQDPTTPISLTEMAAAACISPQYLCRLFRAATGRTPAETVILQRLERARTLLLRSNYTVAEIAELSGFASPFHFSRRFKDIYGLSPRGLRQSTAPTGAVD